MKKNLLIALFIILSSCTQTKQQKAESLVKDYLKTHLNDPNSYESVSFSPIQNVIDKSNGKPAGWWEINHTYRSKNGFGGVITKTDGFSIDTTFSKAECCFSGF
ncbi:MAG: hypothetical protein NVSMB24_21190 [Mucilaginibacter sp.]